MASLLDVGIAQQTFKGLANRLRKDADDLGLQADALAPLIKARVHEALLGIYGPKMGLPDYWVVTWVAADGGAGTLGLLTVKTVDPFVLGYEYGTQEHVEIAHGAGGVDGGAIGGPKRLGFYWANQQANFLGEMVLHPGAKAHHRQEYLIRFLWELGKWGWSRAAEAAFADLGYASASEHPIPATPLIFHGEDESSNKWQPDAPMIYGRPASLRLLNDDHALNVFIGGIMRRRRFSGGKAYK